MKSEMECKKDVKAKTDNLVIKYKPSPIVRIGSRVKLDATEKSNLKSNLIRTKYYRGDVPDGMYMVGIGKLLEVVECTAHQEGGKVAFDFKYDSGNYCDPRLLKNLDFNAIYESKTSSLKREFSIGHSSEISIETLFHAHEVMFCSNFKISLLSLLESVKDKYLSEFAESPCAVILLSQDLINSTVSLNHKDMMITKVIGVSGNIVAVDNVGFDLIKRYIKEERLSEGLNMIDIKEFNLGV